MKTGMFAIDEEYKDYQLTVEEDFSIFYSIECFWCYQRVRLGDDWKWFSGESGAFCSRHRGLWYHEPHIDLSQFNP